MIHEERLELVDLEVVKISLFHKWVFKTIELGESNLQLMLRYILFRYNPQRGYNWEVSLD